MSLGSKSLAAKNNKVVSIDQPLKRVKRQKQRNTLIKCTLKQLQIRWEVLHDGKATALRVQIHWDTNRGTDTEFANTLNDLVSRVNGEPWTPSSVIGHRQK